MFQEHYQHIRENVRFESAEPSPTKWMEKNRYIQRFVSDKMHGKFDFSNVPYMRQITEHLSPYDPVTHVVLMKGVRIGGTFALVHNGIPYIMKERPANILSLSANADLSKKSIEGVDFGIDGCNIRHLIGKSNKSKNNAKGDTAEEKFFSGGFKLSAIGGQSATNYRQITAGIIFIDEVDAFKLFSKDSGNSLNLVEDRAKSSGDSKKIVYISSPLLEESSVIYSLYLDYNQNVYYVPCPKCGAMIELVWNERNENNTRYGVIFDVRNGEVIKKSVRYRCGECENDFAETKKTKYEMLNNGIWMPQIERDNKNRVSYRISALYAPPSMDNWFDFALQFQKAHPREGVRDQGAWQSFQNSILGWPYKPSGIEIKSTKLQKNRREYKINEVPFELCKKDGNGEIILITLSCDLNGYENDGRLDYEIEAHSKKGATYSIDAGSVGTFIPKAERMALEKEGVNIAKLEVERKKYTYQFDKENSVWNEFEKIVFLKFGKNKNISINIVCVDIGHMQDYALEFVRRMKQKNVHCLGVKGAKIEEFTPTSNTDLGKIYNLDSSSTFYLLNVNVIKNKLASYLDSNSYVDDNGQLHQDLNFMNFPEHKKDSKKYTYRNFFAHFEAEHRIEKKNEGGQTKFLWEKRKTGIQNHFWDVSVYNKFARIYMINLICSNDNPFKKLVYNTQKIEANWENASRLVLEARSKRGIIYE
jgi:phage terminase large subunit GpA-like protein